MEYWSALVSFPGTSPLVCWTVGNGMKNQRKLTNFIVFSNNVLSAMRSFQLNCWNVKSLTTRKSFTCFLVKRSSNGPFAVCRCDLAVWWLWFYISWEITTSFEKNHWRNHWTNIMHAEREFNCVREWWVNQNEWMIFVVQSMTSENQGSRVERIKSEIQMRTDLAHRAMGVMEPICDASCAVPGSVDVSSRHETRKLPPDLAKTIPCNFPNLCCKTILLFGE